MKNSLVGFLSLGLTLVSVPSLYGAVGDWTIYPSCGSFWRIEELGAKYYLLTGNTLVEADTANLSDLTTLTRLDGLNGNTVSDIIAAGHLNKLAIIYQDGNIDFLNTDNEISNLPDFANYSVTGDRTISGIGISNDSLCIRTGFGGIVVDMKQELIKSTLYSDYEQDAAALARCRAIVAARTTSSELKQVMNSIQPVNGNQTTLAAQMVFMNGRLYAAQSTYNDYVNYKWGTATISVLDVATGEWKSVSADRLTPMVKAIDSNGSFRELTAIAPDPNDPDLIYACSLEGGIYRIEGDSLTGYYNAHLNPDGMVSLLKDNESRKTRYTRVGAMYVDDNGYLWFTNGDSESEYTLRCLTPDTTFFLCPTTNFTGYASGQFGIIGRLTPTTVTVGANTYNFKWMTRTYHINSAAICIHYDGGTPYDPSDDQSSMFTSITDQDGNVYNPTYFRDLKEDKNGVIWLLTTIVPNETVGAKACPILLFIVDSGTYAEEEIGGYDYVKPLQNEWIKNTAAEYGKASVAYVFQHIPVPQVQEFIEPARKFEIGAFCTYGSIFGDWYKEKEGALKEGHFRESPCPPLIDSSEFQAWKESNVKAAFFGHDHTNDYIGTLDGIDLVATPGIGFFSYGNGEGHGARIVTLHVDRPKEYETQVVCYRDLIDHPIGFLKGAYLGIQLQGTIIPALAGIALFLIAVVVVIILLVRRHQKKKAAKQADTEKGEQPS